MTRHYAISDQRTVAAVTCPDHLEAALDEHPTADAYPLNPEIHYGTERATCGWCKPTVSDATDEDLLDMVRAALAGDPTRMREAVDELQRRHPAIIPILDNYHRHGEGTGIRYAEAVIIATLETTRKDTK
jgi:hypothetical protein